MEKIDPLAVLSAALADDSAELHRLVTGLGTSMRVTLGVAGWRMLNALAAEDARHARLVRYANSATPSMLAILAGDHKALAERPDFERAGAAPELIAHGMMTTRGELTDDGREVSQIATVQRQLLAQVRDRALSDEDFER